VDSVRMVVGTWVIGVSLYRTSTFLAIFN
jgi:hypothetical protein